MNQKKAKALRKQVYAEGSAGDRELHPVGIGKALDVVRKWVAGRFQVRGYAQAADSKRREYQHAKKGVA